MVFFNKKEGVVFFGQIANFHSAKNFRDAICEQKTQKEYVRELTESIFVLSKNTRRKHRSVNLAVVFAGIALLFTAWLLIVLSRS